MAEIKKPADKPETTKAADTKTTTETTPVAAPAAKTETKETGAKKPAAEKKKPGRKPAAEKKKPGRKPAAEKKETATTRKAAVKETVHVQFSGKTYTTEDLVRIAKDVWKYDLKKKVGDFKAVELYVKPEESVVYYVINGEEKGQFNI